MLAFGIGFLYSNAQRVEVQVQVACSRAHHNLLRARRVRARAHMYRSSGL